MIKFLMAAVLAVLFPLLASAGIDSFDFSSDEKREQYQVLVDELRCPKCQNNNLAGSNSMIAMDLKREIHNMVEAGDSNEKIVDFMVTRYGDFVLYRPRIRKETFFLWGTPIAMLGFGLVTVAVIVWRRSRPNNIKNELSAEEQARLAIVLSQDGNSPSNTSSKK